MLCFLFQAINARDPILESMLVHIHKLPYQPWFHLFDVGSPHITLDDRGFAIRLFFENINDFETP